MRRDVQFLLIQDGVLDAKPIANDLCWKWLDQSEPFEVAIGCMNEFGFREIVGVVARVNPGKDATVWALSSELDGYHRITSCAGAIADRVRTRLRVYQSRGRFDDLCNLPQKIEIEGIAR